MAEPSSSPRVLVLGATSLVGSHFVVYGGSGPVLVAGRQDPRRRGFPVEGFTRVDLGDEEAVRKLVRTTEATAVVNFVARTDVDGCESERPRRGNRPAHPDRGSAWVLNSELPRWLAEESASRDLFLLHLSTDFVFDGKAGPYSEEEPPSPLGPDLGWYGYTKGVGESHVAGLARKGKAAIVRISYPYRSGFEGKLDLARGLLMRLASGTLLPMYTDQEITPTWVPDVTDTLSALLVARHGGIYHVASPTVTTPFGFAEALIEEIGVGKGDLTGARLQDVKDPRRAPRPVHGGLRLHNVRRLGVRPTDYREGIRKLVAELGATPRRAGPPASPP